LEPTQDPRIDLHYELEDRYTREEGRVYITGVQALVRLPLLQAARDRAAGLDTAGFISGYRGSPLGTYDMALWQARAHLERARVHFEPGVNEDLAATAVWGSQQAGLYDGARHQGVFGIWYGKGPGVDRSCDALKHANYAGTAAHGGVLALTGDDPSARSSSIAHQSEQALVHCGIPILNPADVQEYLDLGLYGFALSRYSGCWIGFKCLTDTVDSARSVEVGPERVQIRIPEPSEFAPPQAGLNIGWANLPLQVEARLFQQRHRAAQAFVRANALDRVVLDSPKRRLGIVTAGKAYLDVRQALEELGLDEPRAAELGLSLYKLALTWPLEPQGARQFCSGLEEVLVVEEKQAFVEPQLAHLLFNAAERPRLVGKQDLDGSPLVASEGELVPSSVADALRRWLARNAPGLELRERVELAAKPPGELMRLPAFCSGCPHNSSTVVPEGSVALGGIGCHGMAVWLPDRRTLAVTQMGGEGANWVGAARFSDTPHIFQNLGDGTYFHSGLLAVRAAVTAGVNITYKILANGAVAMTGGQPIEGERLEGEVTVPDIVAQLAAEGVERIDVVSNEPDKYAKGAFPASVQVHHRDSIDALQKELREVLGVSALVYDQTCAAEARRLRKRGEFPDPDLRVVINEAVCEGCGDCSVQSNCISIEPVESELGRKRRINQSTCNKDYSCLKGYCPSFATVTGAALRKSSEAPAAAGIGDDSLFGDLPMPSLPSAEVPFNVLVAGIGGSGVVTVGAVLAVAAHLEGKGCSELDVTGLAQKNGPVSSHVRIAARPDDLHATRIAAGTTDLLIGCDIVVASGMDALATVGRNRTTAVVNRHVAPTSDFANNPDLDLRADPMEKALTQAAGDREATHFLEATSLATALLGDAIATNMFLLGFAFQKGRVPVGLAAIQRAIELNGRAREMNLRAFAWGRLAAHDLARVEEAAAPALRRSQAVTLEAPGLESIIADRCERLVAYQNRRYARSYRRLVEQAAERERALGFDDERLASAVARYAFKVMAYKDEYEVARLWTQSGFQEQLEREFEGDYEVRLSLAPQLLFPRDPATGRVRKVSVGSWIFTAFRWLARLKFLRGTPFDIPGRVPHRRRERAYAKAYPRLVDEVLDGLRTDNRDLAIEILSLPEQVRGFDTIKDRHLDEAEAKQHELLASYHL